MSQKTISKKKGVLDTCQVAAVKTEWGQKRSTEFGHWVAGDLCQMLYCHWVCNYILQILSLLVNDYLLFFLTFYRIFLILSNSTITLYYGIVVSLILLLDSTFSLKYLEKKLNNYFVNKTPNKWPTMGWRSTEKMLHCLMFTLPTVKLGIYFKKQQNKPWYLMKSKCI